MWTTSGIKMQNAKANAISIQAYAKINIPKLAATYAHAPKKTLKNKIP